MRQDGHALQLVRLTWLRAVDHFQDGLSVDQLLPDGFGSFGEENKKFDISVFKSTFCGCITDAGSGGRVGQV